MFSLLNAQSLVGLAAIIGLAWAISEDRRRFPWRLALGRHRAAGAAGAAAVRLPQSQAVLDAMTGGVDALAAATRQGTRFVFGYLAGGPQPYAVADRGALFVFAFEVLPLILVISALAALLWHWRILRWIIRGFGIVFQRVMGLGGASALAVAANIFLGTVEAPIIIRGYLDKLSRSELFLLMTVGLATVAGSTMVAYASLLAPTLPDAAGHVLTASIIAAPAGVLLSRIVVPEKLGQGGAYADYGSALRYDSSIDAISRGIVDGLQVVLNISATLIVFVALVALGNLILSVLPDVGGAPITIERTLGLLFTPLAWSLGVPAEEAPRAGLLLGIKMVLTEFVAYIELAKIPVGELSERTRTIMTYALCGFANIGSVGIVVAGLGVLVPERRGEVLELVWKALAAGFLATCVSAAVVGAMPSGALPVKLYTSHRAPNPRRVRWVMAEKGIDDIELVEIDLLKGEQKRAEYRDRVGRPWSRRSNSTTAPSWSSRSPSPAISRRSIPEPEPVRPRPEGDRGHRDVDPLRRNGGGQPAGARRPLRPPRTRRAGRTRPGRFRAAAPDRRARLEAPGPSARRAGVPRRRPRHHRRHRRRLRHGLRPPDPLAPARGAHPRRPLV
jgi:CNT family concentrative nucleoside transporter